MSDSFSRAEVEAAIDQVFPIDPYLSSGVHVEALRRKIRDKLGLNDSSNKFCNNCRGRGYFERAEQLGSYEYPSLYKGCEACRGEGIIRKRKSGEVKRGRRNHEQDTGQEVTKGEKE